MYASAYGAYAQTQVRTYSLRTHNTQAVRKPNTEHNTYSTFGYAPHVRCVGDRHVRRLYYETNEKELFLFDLQNL